MPSACAGMERILRARQNAGGAEVPGLQVRAAFGDAAAWTMFAILSVVAGATGAVACRIAFARRAIPEAAAAASRLGA